MGLRDLIYFRKSQGKAQLYMRRVFNNGATFTTYIARRLGDEGENYCISLTKIRHSAVSIFLTFNQEANI